MTSHSKDAPGGNAQIILVTGAAGNQGGAAAARLLTAGWRVRVLTRARPAGPPGRSPARAPEVAAGDLDDPGSLRVAADGAYGVFSGQQGALSSPPVRFEDEVRRGRNVVDAAAVAGAEHLVYASVAGTDTDVMRLAGEGTRAGGGSSRG